MKMILLLLIWNGVFWLPRLSHAQSNTRPDWEFSATTGPFLAMNVHNVFEILPFAGARIGKGVGSFRPEILMLHGRANGIIYYQNYLSVRNDFKFEDLEAFWITGLHLSDYKQKTVNGRSFPFTKKAGWHIGAGTFWPITKTLKFRSDFYFGFNPGRNLYVGLGLQLNFPEGGSGQDQEP